MGVNKSVEKLVAKLDPVFVGDTVRIKYTSYVGNVVDEANVTGIRLLCVRVHQFRVMWVPEYGVIKLEKEGKAHV